MSALLSSDAPIEADDASVTSDYYEQSLNSSTQSLTSSIQKHVYENGRRYHACSDGKYALPSDESEQDRLDFTHHVFQILAGGELHSAKLPKTLHNVLDAGTGTGIWALEFGDTHPEAQVVGVDLMPIQPNWTAPNVRFEIDDLEKDWTFEKNHFDFIHSRTLMTGIKNWQRYIQQCYDHTKPGGFIEIGEYNLDGLSCDDGTMTKDSKLVQYFERFADCLEKAGINPRMTADDLAKSLEAAGYKIVSTKTKKLPWGPWPKTKTEKHVGLCVAEVLRTGLEAHALALFTRVGGMSPEDAHDLISGTLAEVKSGKIHCYNYHYMLVAQKPESKED